MFKLPLEYNNLIKVTPANLQLTHNYEVQAVMDPEKNMVNISINDRYIGQILYTKANKWWKFNTITIKIENRDYVFNCDSYLQHLKNLGITNCTTQDYLLEVSKVFQEDPMVLERFKDRIWPHLGPQLQKQLTIDYHAALERNDFQAALHLVKSGLPLDNYYTFKCGLKTWVFREEPTPTKLCKIYDESDNVSDNSHFDTIICISHSPLTAVLSMQKNDIQEDKRAQLIQLLKDWGTSTIKEMKEYKIFVFNYDHTSRAKSFKITRHVMS